RAGRRGSDPTAVLASGGGDGALRRRGHSSAALREKGGGRMSTAFRFFPADPLIHELLARRHSTLAFDPDRRVSRLALRTLLEAARVAPSCFNEQPWRFLVFDGEDQDALEEARSCLAQGNSWARQAPVLILSVAAERWSRDGTPNRWAEHDV